MSTTNTRPSQPGEQWAEIDIPGYWISSHGRAWSEKSGKILTPIRNRLSGYYYFSPWHNGRPHPRHYHREVLRAFSGPRPAGYEAAHYPDQDKHNNHIDNLQWAPQQDNLQQAVEAGLAGRKLSEQDVRWIMQRSGEGLRPAQIRRELASERGVRVGKTTIERVLAGYTWTAVSGLPRRSLSARARHVKRLSVNRRRRATHPAPGHPRGERVGSSKLSEQDARWILRRAGEGLRPAQIRRELAERGVRVGLTTVCSVVNGTNWGWLTRTA